MKVLVEIELETDDEQVLISIGELLRNTLPYMADNVVIESREV